MIGHKEWEIMLIDWVKKARKANLVSALVHSILPSGNSPRSRMEVCDLQSSKVVRVLYERFFHRKSREYYSNIFRFYGWL